MKLNQLKALERKSAVKKVVKQIEFDRTVSDAGLARGMTEEARKAAFDKMRKEIDGK